MEKYITLKKKKNKGLNYGTMSLKQKQSARVKVSKKKYIKQGIVCTFVCMKYKSKEE